MASFQGERLAGYETVIGKNAKNIKVIPELEGKLPRYKKIRPDYIDLDKRFYLKIVEHCRNIDPTIEEYNIFMKNGIKDFCYNLFKINKDYGKYNITIFVNSVNVESPSGYYSALDRAPYSFHIQMPDDTIVYKVTCGVHAKITLDEAIISEFSMGFFSFGVPKLFNSREELPGLTEQQRLMFGMSTLASNFFISGNSQYQVSCEESNIPNVIGCRQPEEGIYSLDVISEELRTRVSSHIDLIYEEKTSRVVFSVFLSRLRQHLKLSTRFVFQLLGIYTFEGALEYVVTRNDPDFEKIRDLFGKIWETRVTREYESTRHIYDDIYNVLKEQIDPKNSAQYALFNNNSIRSLLNDSIFPRVNEAKNKSCTIKEMYIGRCYNILIKCKLGLMPTDRYSYNQKSLKTVVKQLKVSVKMTVRKELPRGSIYQSMNEIFKNNKFDETKIPSLQEVLKNTSSRVYENTTRGIMDQIRHGSLFLESKAGKSSGRVMSKNRYFNSRRVEARSQQKLTKNDILYYIKDDGDVGNSSEHALKKRQPVKSMEATIDGTYTPDATNKVGIVRESTAVNRYVAEDISQSEVIESVEKTPGFMDIKHRTDLIDPSYSVIYLDGLAIGKVRDCAEFAKKLIEKRRIGEFNKWTSVTLMMDWNQILLSTAKGRLCSLMFPINKETNKLYLTNEMIESIVKEEMDVIDLIDSGVLTWMFAAECDTILYTQNIQDLDEYDYFVPELLKKSIASLLYMYSIHNNKDTRRSMTSNQNTQLPSTLPDYYGAINTVGQNQMVAVESSYIRSTFDPPYKIPCINLLVAMYAGDGNTEEDSSAVSSEVVNSLMGSMLRTGIINHKAEPGERFINKNMLKEFYNNPISQYSKLNQNGWVDVGTTLNQGDIVMVYSKIKDGQKEFVVKVWDNPKPGRVKRVFFRKTRNQMVLTIICDYMMNIVSGNKVYFTNSCKSVLTEVPACQMPRTEDGEILSIVYSQTSVIKRDNTIPKRIMMTQHMQKRDKNADVAQPADCGLADDDSMLIITDLAQKGEFMGYKTLISPETGSVIATDVVVFMYPVFNNLHLAEPKEHVKNDDPTQTRADANTGQARSGKRNDGGQRSGKLMSYNTYGNGASDLTYNNTNINADGRDYALCITCGSYDCAVSDEDVFYCRRCGPTGNVVNTITSQSSIKLKTLLYVLGSAAETVVTDPVMDPKSVVDLTEE